MDANTIARNIETNTGYRAKVWQKNGHTRVYVSRQLSRGTQDMGYIAIDGDNVILCLTRNEAGIRNAAGL